MHGKLSLKGAMAAAAMLALPQFASTAIAQTWPQRTITIIVSQPAGTSPDILSRLLSERLSGEFKQGVITENKAGGGNVVGSVAAARAAPDGHTFFFATSAALVTNPFMMKALPYDPIKDFAPVAFIGRSSQLIVVNPQVAAKTLPELIALEKKTPGKLTVGVDGPRSLAGVTTLALNKGTGMQLVSVPYPNLVSGVQDLVAGRFEVGVFSVSLVEGLVRDGKLRAIAGAAATPVGALPDVPLASATIPGFDYSGWFMLMAPAGTSPDIVARMNTALNAAMRDEKVRATVPKLGFEVDDKGLGTPQDAVKILNDQMALWKKTTAYLGIEPQ